MISSSSNKVQYNCDGSTTEFTFSFPILQSSDLVVVLTDSDGNETTLTETTDYTVSATGNDYSSGGKITTVKTYASGYTITIVREVPLTQETDYRNYDTFPAETIEDALDKLTMETQQLNEKVTRVLQVPVSDEIVPLEIPVKSKRANHFLAFDADGSPIEADPTEIPVTSYMQTLLDDEDASTAQSTLGIGFIAKDTISNLLDVDISSNSDKCYFIKGYHSIGDGGGGVFYWDANEDKTNHNGGIIIDPDAPFPTDWSDTTQQDTWFNSSNTGTGCWKRVYDGAVNVKWFGAKGDGVTDDSTVLQEVIDFCKLNIIPIFIPNGIYKINSALKLDSNVIIYGESREGTVLTAEDTSANMIFYTDDLSTTSLTQTEDLPAGSTTMNITNSASAGDFIKIKSTQRFTRLWDEGEEIRSYYLDCELMKIESATSSTITFTEPTFLDFPLSAADSVDVFTPKRNIHIRSLSLKVRSDENAYTYGIKILGVDDFSFRDIYIENTEDSGIKVYYSMNGVIDNIYTKGGHVTLGLNYGIAIVDGTKHVKIRNVFGNNNRHAVAGGGTGNGVPMYIEVSNVCCENPQSHVMDAHGICANWKVNNIVGNTSVSGIGHIVSEVTTTGGSMFFACEGGYNCIFKNFVCDNIQETAANVSLYNCVFENIILNYTNPTVTVKFGKGRYNTFKNIQIINKSYDVSMTETEADATIGADACVGMIARYGCIIDGLYIRGFPIALKIQAKYGTINNVRIEECGWKTEHYNGIDAVIIIDGEYTKNTVISNITASMENTTIDNGIRCICFTSGTENCYYTTISNVVMKATNSYYYSFYISDGVDYITLLNVILDQSTDPYTGTGSHYKVWNATGISDS